MEQTTKTNHALRLYIVAQRAKALVNIIFCSSSQTCRAGEKEVTVIHVLRQKTVWKTVVNIDSLSRGGWRKR